MLLLWRILAVLVPALHLLFIGWVIFGALLTRGRRWATLLHWLTLAYGIWIEITPRGCPLTRLENAARLRAGSQPYQGDFIRHYLLNIIYPNVPVWVLIAGAILVCLVNAIIYGRRLRRGELSMTRNSALR